MMDIDNGIIGLYSSRKENQEYDVQETINHSLDTLFLALTDGLGVTNRTSITRDLR